MRTAPLSDAAFAVHAAEFRDVLGAAPRLERVLETDAHEGPVYVADEDALYFTSLPRPAPPAHASTSAAWRSTAIASRSSPSG